MDTTADASALLRLQGELSIHAAAEQHALLLDAVQAPGALTLELSAIEACDSAGVQLLLAARRSMAERGLALHLQSPSTAVREALQTYGLVPLFPATGA